MSVRLFSLLGLAAVFAFPALGIDEAHKQKAQEIAGKASNWLKGQQDKATGGWSVPAAEGSPHLPGITGLVVSGMLLDPKADQSDPSILQGIKYMLNFQQADGGIYDKMLPSYNTSLALSALSKSSLPQAKDSIVPAQQFLKNLQIWEGAKPVAEGGVGGPDGPKPVGKEHPFYGGVGYGKHGRPDGSNVQMFVQALHDSGVSPNDDSMQRAVAFMQRLQMLDKTNDMPYADGSKQGGFVYATVENAQSVDAKGGQSQAGMIEETLDDGTKVSRLRCYGSMSYAGFKSYLYADLPRNDDRVQAALGWIKSNYTLEENPAMGTDGLYYYFVSFSRALTAWGEPTLEVATTGKSPDGKPVTKKIDWANDLIDRLATLQNTDGSFKSVDDRWMENNQVLITAYALIAVREASK